MNTTLPFINIHTHRTRQIDERSVLSLYAPNIDSSHTEHDYVSYGIHPWYIPADWETYFSILQSKWLEPDCLFVGECGLDPNSIHPLSLQETVFVRQAQWAAEHNLPMILHCVRTIDRIIFHHKQFHPKVPWIIHGFRGNPKQMEQLLHLGFYFSFGIHYHPISAATCPSDRFFIETDDIPVSIAEVYQQIAKIRNQSVQQLTEQQTENCNRLLKIRSRALNH